MSDAVTRFGEDLSRLPGVARTVIWIGAGLTLALIALLAWSGSHSTAWAQVPGGKLPWTLPEGVLPEAPAPPPGVEAPAPAATPAAVAALHEVVVSSYAGTFRVSRVEARQRLDLQDKGKQLSIKLRAKFGRGFSQVKFDNGAGHHVVAISPTADYADVRKALDDLGLQSAKIERVELDHVQLADRVAALSRRLEAVILAGHAGVGETADGLTVTVAKNAPEEAGASIADAAAAYDAVTKQSPRENLTIEPTTCNGGFFGFPATNFTGNPPARFCDSLRGGSRYYMTKYEPGITWESGCSLSWWAGAAGASYYSTYFLTAGHCMQGPISGGMGNPWRSCAPTLPTPTCPNAGWETAVNYGGAAGDNGAMYISNSGTGREPGWTDWRTGARLAVQYYATPGAGDWVCQGGSTTGLSCGTMIETNYTANYPAIQGQVGELHSARTVTGLSMAQGPCTQGETAGALSSRRVLWVRPGPFPADSATAGRMIRRARWAGTRTTTWSSNRFSE